MFPAASRRINSYTETDYVVSFEYRELVIRVGERSRLSVGRIVCGVIRVACPRVDYLSGNGPTKRTAPSHMSRRVSVTTLRPRDAVRHPASSAEQCRRSAAPRARLMNEPQDSGQPQ